MRHTIVYEAMSAAAATAMAVEKWDTVDTLGDWRDRVAPQDHNYARRRALNCDLD